MQLNTLAPAPGSTKAKKRVGRGIGSGSGKTSGRGHKGQKSRSGGTVKPGFEGGQMPLQMRLPKFGFSSRVGRITAEVRTAELNKVEADVIDIAALRKANLITVGIKRVKVMLSGEVTKAVTLQGIGVTKGARAAIEKAGGKIIEEAAAKTEKPKPKKAAKQAAKAEAAAAEEKPVEKPAEKPMPKKAAKKEAKAEVAAAEEKPAEKPMPKKAAKKEAKAEVAPVEEKPVEEKPAEEKPAEEKPAEDPADSTDNADESDKED